MFCVCLKCYGQAGVSSTVTSYILSVSSWLRRIIGITLRVSNKHVNLLIMPSVFQIANRRVFQTCEAVTTTGQSRDNQLQTCCQSSVQCESSCPRSFCYVVTLPCIKAQVWKDLRGHTPCYQVLESSRLSKERDSLPSVKTLAPSQVIQWEEGSPCSNYSW